MANDGVRERKIIQQVGFYFLYIHMNDILLG